ncbi:hypothetical protein BS47DRAFT_1267415, partial [Hydnum rufescens UP504]
WLGQFLQCHKKDLQYCQSSALDPKHAWCFNYSTVQDYFGKLKAILVEYDIPWENV